jgi:hypothetical protein
MWVVEGWVREVTALVAKEADGAQEGGKGLLLSVYMGSR